MQASSTPEHSHRGLLNEQSISDNSAPPQKSVPLIESILPYLRLENIKLSMTEARRIHYGTPCQFRTVTHGQLEHFDNKPPPRPLEEPSTVKTAGTIQSVAKTGSEAEKDSAATRAAVKDNTWNPDQWGGWDGHVTEFDARTMYLG